MLQTGRIGTAEHPIVQRLEGDSLLGQLPLGILMAIEAYPCRVGEIGGELDKERPEVIIDQVEVVVVTHHRAAAEPGKGHAAFTEPLGDTKAGELLLCLADEQHALAWRESGQALLGDIILALALGKGDDLNALAFGKVVDRLDIGMTHRTHQRGRGYLGTTMSFEEGRDPRTGLQHGLVQIQIHPVDSFDIQCYLLCEQLTDGLSYHDCRPRLTFWLYATPPLRAATNASIALRRSAGASLCRLTTRRSEA